MTLLDWTIIGGAVALLYVMVFSLALTVLALADRVLGEGDDDDDDE